jgi:acetoin utilization deacetylase AcuC-like enzyme
MSVACTAPAPTREGDPLGGFKLSRACYTAIGQRIRQLGLPVAIIQEGGYAIAALGDNVVALLDGVQGT